MDVDVGLAADGYVRTRLVAVGEVIESEDYGAIRRIFKRDDTEVDVSPLNDLKDFCTEVSTIRT